MTNGWHLMRNGRRRRVAIVLASVILPLLLGTAVRAEGSTAGALSPDTTHYGKSYSQWSTAWWQWALAIPVHSPPFSSRVNHPLVDLSGVQCAVGQSGPVWYLGGAFFQSGTPASSTIVRNNCTVPQSKALFFPLLNIECSTLEGPSFGCTSDVQGNRNIVKSVIDQAANLSAEIDSVSVPISGSYRVSPQKPTFCFSLPPDDILTFIGEGPYSPGTYCPAADDGYYVMLAPLSAGSHTVHFHGEIPAFGFTLDVTYKLNVAPVAG
jgi:hypothetical protein